MIKLFKPNRFETYIMTSCEEAVEYCKRVGSKNVNILLDTFHMNIEEDNLPDAIRKAGPLLGHFHVGEGNRKLPGMSKGSMPWEEMGKALREIGYNKAVVAEPFLLPGGSVGADIKVWRDWSSSCRRLLRKNCEFLVILSSTNPFYFVFLILLV